MLGARVVPVRLARDCATGAGTPVAVRWNTANNACAHAACPALLGRRARQIFEHAHDFLDTAG